jgi:hypothetical protein
MEKLSILLQQAGPLPSTAGAESPNTIWKVQLKQNLATYVTQLLTSKGCPLISFKTRQEGEITWYME